MSLAPLLPFPNMILSPWLILLLWAYLLNWARQVHKEIELRLIYVDDFCADG